MAKRPKPVVMAKKDDLVITIKKGEIWRKVRKPMPPPTKIHRSKKWYRRRSKHDQKTEEE